jgi:hypothetical protein
MTARFHERVLKFSAAVSQLAQHWSRSESSSSSTSALHQAIIKTENRRLDYERDYRFGVKRGRVWRWARRPPEAIHGACRPSPGGIGYTGVCSGDLDGANLIKLHRQSGKVSYLVYPDFETDSHPSIQRSVELSLRTREIDCFDYTASSNPPILHRKQTYLTADHPLYANFARLTQQQEKHGLLDDAATIGTKDGWQARLDATGFVLRGHRLVRR